jgi:hypothetical protein
MTRHIIKGSKCEKTEWKACRMPGIGEGLSRFAIMALSFLVSRFDIREWNDIQIIDFDFRISFFPEKTEK